MSDTPVKAVGKPFTYTQTMHEAQSYADQSGESSVVFFDPVRGTHHWWTMSDLMRPEPSLRTLLNNLKVTAVVVAHTKPVTPMYGTSR